MENRAFQMPQRPSGVSSMSTSTSNGSSSIPSSVPAMINRSESPLMYDTSVEGPPRENNHSNANNADIQRTSNAMQNIRYQMSPGQEQASTPKMEIQPDDGDDDPFDVSMQHEHEPEPELAAGQSVPDLADHDNNTGYPDNPFLRPLDYNYNEEKSDSADHGDNVF